MDKHRELIDTSFQQYFIDYVKKYYGNEGDENGNCKDKQKRYETLFVKSYLETGKELENKIMKVPKYITFQIENSVSFRVAFLFNIAYDNGKYTPYSKNGDTVQDILKEILESGIVKSVDFGVENDRVTFDRVATLLNEIRKKVDTRYADSERDFIEDFFINVYQKEIKNILLTLANTHFQEAVVIKEGNTYSVLYNDMEGFMQENPSFDFMEELKYVDLMLFTRISPELKIFKQLPEDIEYNELNEIEIFSKKAYNYREKLINKTLEDMSIDDSLKDGELDGEQYLENLDKNKDLFYFDNIFEEEMSLLSINPNFFTSQNVIAFLDDLNMLNGFYIRYKDILDDIEIEEDFMKFLVIHYIVLENFVRNIRKYYSELNQEINRINFQDENEKRV